MTTQEIIKSYPYVQFQDDENITAWFDSYNDLAQTYLDWFNDTPLSIYTNDNISGPLLDWVAAGVYGCYRTPISSGCDRVIGTLNTYTPDYIPFNKGKVISNQKSFLMTDDIFKRVITWNFYKSDGTALTIPWLKNRVSRFLGVDYTDVSVTFSGKFVSVAVTNSTADMTNYLASIMEQGLVNLPFGYTFTVESK